MEQLVVSSSPHLRTPVTTNRIMNDVLIALAPAAVAAGVLFGLSAVILMAVCIAGCVLLEWLYQKGMKKPVTIQDHSAMLTGLLLAFCLPADLPVWMALVGCFVSIIVVKQLFGGLGHNFANPAIVGRIVLMFSFGDAMNGAYPVPFAYLQSPQTVDTISAATPLATSANIPYTKLLLGLHGGSLGEVFALGLLLGGIYLILRKVISITIPATYLGTVALLALLFGQNPLFHLLSGGVLLGAFFMATDYVSSPITEPGKFLYALLAGLITMLIRVFGNYPEGVSFAILLLNILTPHIDTLTRKKPLGGAKSHA